MKSQSTSSKTAKMTRHDEYRLWALVCDYASRLDFTPNGKDRLPASFVEGTSSTFLSHGEAQGAYSRMA